MPMTAESFVLMVALAALALLVAKPISAQQQSPEQPDTTTTRIERLHVTHNEQKIKRGANADEAEVGESVHKAQDAELSIKVKSALAEDPKLGDDPIEVK